MLVIGLRLSADAQAGKTELETLFQHHAFTRTGFSVLPQGTPTNNTEAVGSGYGRDDDPDESFNDRKAPLFTPAADWLDKKDGQWLGEYLGLDPALFAHTHHAGASDQLAARAMNIALWPATLGYWMESMMAPVFPSDAIEKTREFFNRYVVAGGAVPAIRIGNQPYGILPATKFSEMRWLDQRIETPRINSFCWRAPATPCSRFSSGSTRCCEAMSRDWRALLADVSFVGKTNGDPHAMLLDIVGLHSGSVDWWQRYAESLRTLLQPAESLGARRILSQIQTILQRAAARGVARAISATPGAKEPLILEKIFSGRNNHLTGGVVDDLPLSESAPIRGYTPAGANYLQWLIDAAHTSLDALYQQNGFTDDKPPRALLFLLLRHALQLGYDDVTIRLNENAGIFTAEQAFAARADDPFLHIRDNQAVSESRYARLFAVAPQITQSSTQTVQRVHHRAPAVAEFCVLSARATRRARTVEKRADRAPRARLCRSHRLLRLSTRCLAARSRQLPTRPHAQPPRRLGRGPRQGIYLGAYAWLEDLRPENKKLTPVRLTDPDLIKDFGDAAEPPLMRDSQNQGYIHAPSLNHAVTAAVLRNGYISDAEPAKSANAGRQSDLRARPHRARHDQGIRAGQSLGELLGYQFERGLHDRHSVAEVDKFIYKLRRAFPLRADRMRDTKTAGRRLDRGDRSAQRDRRPRSSSST